MNNESIPWIVFKLKDSFFSISSQNVVSIIKEPKITKIQKSPDFVKGLFCFRDETFKLIDLRKVFTIENIDEEHKRFAAIMDQRADDHKNWLTELENSVKEKREFSLTTDPHKCAFGKWYDSYRNQENLSLGVIRVLNQFDEPHKKIHKIAHKVEELSCENDYVGAQEVIEQTRKNELSSMIGLFDKIKDQYKESRAHFVIVMKQENHKTAVAVDFVDSVEVLNNVDTSVMDNKFVNPNNSKIFEGLAKTSDEKMVLKLSDEEIIACNF